MNAVDIGADRLFEALVDAREDAADGDLRTDARLRHLEVGHLRLKVFDLPDALLLHGLTGDGGDGQRNILKALGPLTGRDDDVSVRCTLSRRGGFGCLRVFRCLGSCCIDSGSVLSKGRALSKGRWRATSRSRTRANSYR